MGKRRLYITTCHRGCGTGFKRSALTDIRFELPDSLALMSTPELETRQALPNPVISS